MSDLQFPGLYIGEACRSPPGAPVPRPMRILCAGHGGGCFRIRDEIRPAVLRLQLRDIDLPPSGRCICRTSGLLPVGGCIPPRSVRGLRTGETGRRVYVFFVCSRRSAPRILRRTSHPHLLFRRSAPGTPSRCGSLHARDSDPAYHPAAGLYDPLLRAAVHHPEYGERSPCLGSTKPLPTATSPTGNGRYGALLPPHVARNGSGCRKLISKTFSNRNSGTRIIATCNSGVSRSRNGNCACHRNRFARSYENSDSLRCNISAFSSRK